MNEHSLKKLPPTVPASGYVILVLTRQEATSLLSLLSAELSDQRVVTVEDTFEQIQRQLSRKIDRTI